MYFMVYVEQGIFTVQYFRKNIKYTTKFTIKFMATVLQCIQIY